MQCGDKKVLWIVHKVPFGSSIFVLHFQDPFFLLPGNMRSKKTTADRSISKENRQESLGEDVAEHATPFFVR